MREKRSLISASEVGDYVFCALAWRMRAEGHKTLPSAQAAQESGTQWHHEHGRGVRRSRQARLAATVITALAIFLTLLLILYLVMR
jgi:hypothetical protein